MRRSIELSVVCAAFLATSPLSAKDLRIGILTDGPVERSLLDASILAREADAIYLDDLKLTFAVDKQLNGNWNLQNIDAALGRLEADPQVDVVVALGFIASQVAGHEARLPKPTIAAFIADPKLQSLPVHEGMSGRHNFTYAATFNGLADQIETFHRVTPFRHLAVMSDQLVAQALPELRSLATDLQAKLNVSISVIPTDDAQSAVTAIGALPPDTDAVYLTPLVRLSISDIQRVADHLNQRKIPSFSMLGRSEVDQGVLLSNASDTEQIQRMARRIVLDIQRIAQGENAAQLEVAFQIAERLIINMHTASIIGFSPRWNELTDALQVGAEQIAPNSQPINLVQALNAALNSNPSLRSSQIGVDLASDDVKSQRASLLPNLSVDAQHSQIDSGHASILSQAQRQSEADASFQQVLYSDSKWASYSVSKRMRNAADENARQTLLDTLDQTASAYFSVLKAKSVEFVRRQNVENTRKNLETSRVRESVGLATHSDYLRWVSEMATARQDLLSAQSSTREASIELARLIHLDPGAPLTTADHGIEEPLAWVASPRTQRYLDTPARSQTFEGFILSRAVTQAPELRSADERIAGQERNVTAARRAFFVPDISLTASGSNIFHRGGVASETISPIPTIPYPPDTSWQVGVKATLPIFSGGALAARLSQSKHDLKQLSAQRDATADSIVARAKSVLARLNASYPSIALAQEGAKASRDNYQKVGDAYSRGLLSITDLISAQSDFLNADLQQAQATFTFLTDFADALRVSNNFDLLLDPETRAGWYDSVDAWFVEHNMPLPSH